VIEAILNTKPHKWNCSWNQPVWEILQKSLVALMNSLII